MKWISKQRSFGDSLSSFSSKSRSIREATTSHSDDSSSMFSVPFDPIQGWMTDNQLQVSSKIILARALPIDTENVYSIRISNDNFALTNGRDQLCCTIYDEEHATTSIVKLISYDSLRICGDFPWFEFFLYFDWRRSWRRWQVARCEYKVRMQPSRHLPTVLLSSLRRIHDHVQRALRRFSLLQRGFRHDGDATGHAHEIARKKEKTHPEDGYEWEVNTHMKFTIS